MTDHRHNIALLRNNRLQTQNTQTQWLPMEFHKVCKVLGSMKWRRFSFLSRKRECYGISNDMQFDWSFNFVACSGPYKNASKLRITDLVPGKCIV